jgi:SAM-dependent methyltransferase
MRQAWSEKLKQRIRPALFRLIGGGREHFTCPICNYHGPFKDKLITKSPPVVRRSSKCPGCTATERHRMMFLVLRELFADWDAAGKSLLHIAPEECLRPHLTRHFETYHTADLLRNDVDFNEDIQAMSFADGSYDCVLVSRVLTIPPDLERSVAECRRILKPGGLAIIAEIHKHEKTLTFDGMINHRSREIGIDVIDLYKDHFRKVDLYLSNRYDAEYQLINLMVAAGRPQDDFPAEVRVPGRGFQELVAIGHA